MLGDRIKEARIVAGLTQQELAEKVGLSKNAVCNYEKGVSSPKSTELLARIMEVLHVDANFIYQDEMKRFDSSQTLSQNEYKYIQKYRALDKHGMAAVDSILSIEYERCNAQRSKPTDKCRIIKLSIQPASAGLGVWLDSDDFDDIAIPDVPEYGMADFAVRISGDSMEPTYSDGDIVLVSKQLDINIGDIGLFCLNGQGYIKELGRDTLISHNKRYGDLALNDSVRSYGKVIGKL